MTDPWWAGQARAPRTNPDEPGQIRTRAGRFRTNRGAARADTAGEGFAPPTGVGWSGVVTDDGPAYMPTVSGYGFEWLERRRARGIVSVDDDASRFAIWIQEPLGGLLLSELTARIVSRWLARVASADIAPRTVRRIYQVLAGLMKSAALDGLIPSSPCFHTAQLPPDVDADPERLARAPLSPAEASKLIGSFELPPGRRALWATAILTGLRAGELGGLEWRDIDRSRRPLPSIRVVRQWDRRAAAVRHTKTRIPRLIPVHERLSRILDMWAGVYPGGAAGDRPVFVTGRGARWGADSAKKALERDCKRLGIDRRTPHNLRTTFVTLARNSPMAPPRDLVAKLTHTTRTHVLDMYTVTDYAALCRVVSAISIP